MNGTTFIPYRKLNYKTHISVLALIALVFNVISIITSFITYEETKTQIGKYWETYYEASFNFTAYGLLIALLNITPYILLTLYIFKLSGSITEAFTVPLIFISTAISACIDLTVFDSEVINIIFLLVILFNFGLAVFSALKGLAYKIFIIIPTAAALVFDFISLIASVQYLKMFAELETYAYILNNISATVALALLSVALLLLGLKNTTSAILPLSPTEEQNRLKNSTPEQALKILKDKLELGLITEEEYRAEREKIIISL